MLPDLRIPQLPLKALTNRFIPKVLTSQPPLPEVCKNLLSL